MGSSLFLNGGTVLAKTVSETHQQANHGFVVGDVIRYHTSLGRFVKAQANNAENAEVAGVVSTVNDPTSFTMVYSGFIEMPAVFDGISYPVLFLSSTVAGGLTFSPPSAIGTVVKPVAVRSNNKKGHLVVNYLGTQIGGSSTVAIDQIQPVGTISPYAGVSTPDTWLECNGISYAISDYPELYDRLLYDVAPRAPLYGYVSTLTGTGFSALVPGDIIQYKTSTTNWSGNAADSNAEVIAVVHAVSSNTVMTVGIVPKYSPTDKNFTVSNSVLLGGSFVQTETATGNYRAYTSAGVYKSLIASVSTQSITHFNTPDLRGRFALGRNTTAIGESETDGTYRSFITGVYPLASEGGQEFTSAPTGVASGSNAYVTSSPISGGLVANMPPYLSLRYIIKARPYTRAAIIGEVEIDYPNLLVSDLRSGLQRGSAGVGEDLIFRTNRAAFTSGTEQMRLSNSGNLGIGTVSPAKKLHIGFNVNNSGVTGFQDIDGLVLQNSNTAVSGGNKVALRFDTFNSGQAGNAFGSYIGLGAVMGQNSDHNDMWVFSEYFAGYSLSPQTTPIMCFKGNDGRIGIGTATPASTLHISRPSCELRLTDTLVGNADWGILPQTNNSTKLFRIIDRNIGGNNIADRLVIDSLGRVGIGTGQNTTSSTLSVYSTPSGNLGANAFTCGLNSTNSLTSGQGAGAYMGIGYNIEFTNSVNSWRYRGNDRSSLLRWHNGGFEFWGTGVAGSAGAAITMSKFMTIAASGNIGCGTDPDNIYRLKIQGKIYASDDIVAFSDARFKKDISPINDALNKVRSLVGVLYTDSSDTRKTGLLAQDVQAVLPEAVTTDENGKLALAYGNLAGILVQAIKELAIRVDQLEKR